MFDARTNLSQQVADEVRKHFANTFKTIIPRSVRLSEAPSHGLPIALYDASSRANKAYEELARELIASGGGGAMTAPRADGDPMSPQRQRDTEGFVESVG
jgi:cellulose biosynthesis protein BcsQ